MAIIGNCQAKQIEALLGLISEDSLQVAATKSVHLLGNDDQDTFQRTLGSADIVLTQHISDGFPIRFAQTGNLRASLREEPILFSNIYTTAYNTQCSFLVNPITQQRITGPLDGIHFPAIIKSYSAGLSTFEARQSYLSASRSLTQQAVNASINELIRRDHEFRVHIPFSHSMKNLLPSALLLHTFHHPSIHLVAYMAKKIHAYLDLPPPARLDLNLVNDPVIKNDTIHIAPHPASMEILDAQFKPSDFFRAFTKWQIHTTTNISLQCPRLVRLKEVIELFYLFYDDLLRESIDVGSLAAKPY